MSGAIELTDGVPAPAKNIDQSDDVTIYGMPLATSAEAPAARRRFLAYGFSFQGHCYRLSMPVEFMFEVEPADATPDDARGCGFGDVDGYTGGKGDQQPYKMWKLEKMNRVTRIERRRGTLEELLLDFNLPGRSPATLTYSAKVAIAGRAGKAYE